MSANHQSPDVTVELFLLERSDAPPSEDVRRHALRWRSGQPGRP